MSAPIFATTDPLGRKVVLSGRTWNRHIVTGHPEMSGRENVVKKAVESPEYIIQDPTHSTRQQYIDLIEEPVTNSLAVLKVIVEFSSTTSEGTVVTSYSPSILRTQTNYGGGVIYERQ